MSNKGAHESSFRSDGHEVQQVCQLLRHLFTMPFLANEINGGILRVTLKEQRLVGTLDGYARLATDTSTAHADNVEAPEATVTARPLHRGKGRHVLADSRLAAEHRHAADPAELMNNHESGDERTLLNLHMARQHGCAGDDGIIADAAVVTDVARIHDHDAVTHDGFSTILQPAMNRGIFPQFTLLTNADTAVSFRIEADKLGIASDGGVIMQPGSRSNDSSWRDRGAVHQDTAFTDLRIRADEGMGADFRVLVNTSGGIDHGGGVNQHRFHAFPSGGARGLPAPGGLGQRGRQCYGIAGCVSKRNALPRNQMFHEISEGGAGVTSLSFCPVAVGAILLGLAVPAAGPADGTIKVIDENGEAVSGAKALVVSEGRLSTHNVIMLDEKGRGKHEQPNIQEMNLEYVDVYVSAPGFSGKSVRIDEKVDDFDIEVVLEKGRELRLAVVTADGTPLPKDAKLVCYTPDTAGYCWWTTTSGTGEAFSYLSSVRDGDDFVIMLPAGDIDLYYGIHAPGVMRFWSANEPITEDSPGRVDVKLPPPGALEATFTKGESGEPGPLHVVLSASFSVGERRYSVQIQEEDIEKALAMKLHAEDLAPGSYSVEAGTGLLYNRWMSDRPDHYRDRTRATISSGETSTVTMTYAPFSEGSLKGEHTVVLNLKRHDGSPLSNTTCRLVYRDRRRGQFDVGTGKTDNDGRISFTKLASGVEFQLIIGEKESEIPGERLTLASGDMSITRNVTAPPMAGDIAPDIALTEMVTGDSKKLSDYRGQVLFLDFWATWCGPCQAPMQHNSAILEKRAADWDGRATILGISCDEELQTLKDHVAAHEWENVPHMWCEDGGTGWGSKPMRTYGISGVPTAFLLDQSGTIVWRGHPATINVEERIDKLLNEGG